MFRSIVVLASIVLALALAEIALRFTPDHPWYERIEEQAANIRVHLRQVGTKQFKVRESLGAAPAKADKTYRILFLGDSFTYGWRVEDARQVFPSRVTEKLQSLEPQGSSRHFEHFNGGIPGSLTHQWVSLLDEIIAPFDPDLVVAVFFLRDGTRGLGSVSNIKKIREAMRKARRESFFFRHFRLFRFVFERQMQRQFSKGYLNAMERAYTGTEEQTAEWRRARTNLLTMRDQARARGSDFVLVIFPVLFGLNGDYPLAPVMNEIERFGTENEISTLSLLPAFDGKHEPDLWISSVDQHPNERAHAIAADAIVEFLAARVSAPGSKN